MAGLLPVFGLAFCRPYPHADTAWSQGRPAVRRHRPGHPAPRRERAPAQPTPPEPELKWTRARPAASARGCRGPGGQPSARSAARREYPVGWAAGGPLTDL